jgi:hypothetical protein
MFQEGVAGYNCRYFPKVTNKSNQILDYIILSPRGFELKTTPVRSREMPISSIGSLYEESSFIIMNRAS